MAPQGRTVAGQECDGSTLGWIKESLQDSFDRLQMWDQPAFDPANGSLTRQKRPANSSSNLRFNPFSAGFSHTLKSLGTVLVECGSDVGPSLSMSPLAAKTRASVPVGQRRRFAPAFRIRPRVRLRRRPRGPPCRGRTASRA